MEVRVLVDVVEERRQKNPAMISSNILLMLERTSHTSAVDLILVP
jgi:hypothetical protein